MDATETATIKLPSLSNNAGKPALEGTIISTGPLGGLPFEVWDINETIGQLAYLTHNHFRYYGKFPGPKARSVLPLPHLFCDRGNLVS